MANQAIQNEANYGERKLKKEDFTIIQKTKYSKDKISMLELQVLSMMGVFPA